MQLDHMDIRQTIASRISERRKELGKTQKEAAALVGISPQQWQKYELATNRVSVEMLAKISDIFDVPVTFFYACFGETFQWEHELLLAWRKLSPKRRLMATSFVKEMAENKEERV